MNEIQIVGTAQSYKQLPSPQMLSLVNMESRKDAQALDFAEPPIAKQLDANARSLGFDIAYDPHGGLFKYPAGASMADELLPDAYVAAMSAPGFKVIHVLDVDYHSSCLTLVDCLQTVATWSRANPSHTPIVIVLRSNDERTPMPGAVRPIPFDAAAFDALETEIHSVFGADEIVTPDMLQGSYKTLREAAMAHNWPKLGASRGKVLFVFDDSPAKAAIYRGDRSSLEGRTMFLSMDETSPLSAFVSIDDPLKNAARITADVKSGFMVITRADADTVEARAGNTARRDWALASGAQIVSTNFIHADSRIGTYEVRLSNNRRVQCDVQLAPERCAIPAAPRGNDIPAAMADTGK